MEQIGPVYKSDTILTESSNAYSKQSITNLKLNHVKRIQYSVIKHKCKIIYMISENRTKVGYYAKYSLIRVNRKALGSCLRFSEAILNSFDMSNNEERHLQQEMYVIHRGPCLDSVTILA